MRPTVLIVDDNPADRFAARRRLRPAYAVLEAESAADAHRVLEARDVDCLVLDLSLPDMDGLTFLDSLRTRRGELPFAVIMLTGHGSEGLAVQAMRSGVDDYLSKYDIDGDRLPTLVGAALERSAMRREARATLRLVSEDAVTGLPGRGMLLEHLDALSARTMAKSEAMCAALVAIDDYDRLRAERGARRTDDLLSALADRVLAVSGHDELLGRVGHDALLLVSSSPAGPHTARNLHDRLTTALDAPDGSVDAHAGIATMRGAGPRELLRLCRAALEDARAPGSRQRVALLDCTASEVADTVTADALRVALADGELELRFQPLLELSSRALVDFEVLVRWRHPELGVLPPARFIRLAEERGLIGDLGRWVLEAACRQAKQWMRDGQVRHRVWVNVAAQQLDAPDFGASVLETIAACGIPGSALGLEVTESAILRQTAMPAMSATLETLRSHGVAIALDDFGTGFSSLATLSELPIDELKLDRSLIQRAAIWPRTAAVVASMVDMAHALDIRVVAEGIETEHELSVVRESGCELGQGFLFARPMEVAEIDHKALVHP